MAYSPTLGRWMQQDPAGYVDGLDLYEGERSSPTSGLDPTGLSLTKTEPNSIDPDLLPQGRGLEPTDVDILTDDFLRRYVEHHRYSGTGVAGLTWVEHGQPIWDGNECTGFTVTQQYEARGTLISRVDNLYLSPASAARLAPGVAGQLQLLIAEFKAQDAYHERVRQDMWAKFYDTHFLEFSGSGKTKDEAEKKLKKNFEEGRAREEAKLARQENDEYESVANDLFRNAENVFIRAMALLAGVLPAL